METNLTKRMAELLARVKAAPAEGLDVGGNTADTRTLNALERRQLVRRSDGPVRNHTYWRAVSP